MLQGTSSSSNSCSQELVLELVTFRYTKFYSQKSEWDWAAEN